MERVIVIVGPTCSGKTALSIELSKIIDCEIISADSRQVYKLLDIGTAKPSESELASVKHHFIGELFPDEEFNASIFEKKSLKIISELFDNHKIPVVAGGSGLYVKALIEGISENALSAPEYREELMKIRLTEGNEKIYQMLLGADPVSAGKMLPQNWKRVIRALEVLKASGKPIWQVHAEDKRKVNYSFVQFGLKWDRSALYENINSRVDKMIESGLVEEVRNILDSGYSPELNSLNTVGYKEIISYLKKEISLDRAIELIKRNTRRFAKRQMTWFRKDDSIHWLNIDGGDDIKKSAELIYSINFL